MALSSPLFTSRPSAEFSGNQRWKHIVCFFRFTVTFHYLFPQLTMGLALLIVYLKTKALHTGDEHYDESACFWARPFGINFAIGVVTGIPVEFQFGTNWAQFSKTAEV